jgi:hypothetical protein
MYASGLAGWATSVCGEYRPRNTPDTRTITLRNAAIDVTTNCRDRPFSVRAVATNLPSEIHPCIEIACMPKKLVSRQPTRLCDTTFPGALGHLELRPSEHSRLKAVVVVEPPQLRTEDYAAEALKGPKDRQ